MWLRDLRFSPKSASVKTPVSGCKKFPPVSRHIEGDCRGIKMSLRIASNTIPFLDLITPHVELEQELTDVFRKALRGAGFIGGPMVEGFQRAFAAFCNTDHSIAVCSGTDAVHFALMACGVRSGDVVLTVPHTFIATTEAISQAGALPEFVDIDERTYNMDPAKLQEYMESQCKADPMGRLISCRSGRPVTAVVPVHLYGQAVDMDPILELADRYGLIVVEDACQAHGAEYFSQKHNRWMKAGSMGRAAAFSFYPGKNLRSLWRSGGSSNERCRSCRQNQVATRSRPGEEPLPTTWKVTTDGWMPSGGFAACEAYSSGEVERTTPGAGGKLQPVVCKHP